MKIVSRLIISCFLILFLSISAIGQDSTKFWTVSFDLFKAIIDEYSLTFGHKISNHQYVSLSLGYTYYNSTLRNTFETWSSDQGEFPIFVYTGPTFRGNYDFGTFTSPHFGAYIGIDIYYKHLSYKNYQFLNESGGYYSYNNPYDYGDDEEFHKGYNYFTRSETANVYGAHFHFGYMVTIGKHIFINNFFGIGKTYKYRLNTTTNSTYGNEPTIIEPDGTFSENQNYFSPLITLDLGYRF